MLALAVTLALGQGAGIVGSVITPPCQDRGAEVGHPDAVDAVDAKGSAPPTRLKHVAPEPPPRPKGVTGRAVWIAEIVVTKEGSVAGYWPLHEPTFAPAWPEASQAVEKAVRQWVFEAPLVGGRPAPVCMTVVVRLPPASE
jgi:hypothetical protein